MTALGLVVALALVAAGCLFVDEINRAPVARAIVRVDGRERTLDQPIVLDRKCLPVLVDAVTSFDPDGAPQNLSFDWRLDGQPAASSDRVEFAILGPPSQAQVTFRTAGAHVVEVVALDRRKAASPPARAELEVRDAPPKARLFTPPASCGEHALGRLELAAATEGVDEDAACETITYAWSLRPPPGSQGALVRGPCPQGAVAPGQRELAPEVADLGRGKLGHRACLVPDRPGDYLVRLVVDDGAGRAPGEQEAGGQIVEQAIRVAADRPPCMAGFAPAPGFAYLLDRGQAARFEVTEVQDDLDRFPGEASSRLWFRWSIWQERNPIWREVAGHRLPSFDLDPKGVATDELVRIRAQAVDRLGMPIAGCDPSRLLCDWATAYPQVSGCLRKPTCQAWVTWELRFR